MATPDASSMMPTQRLIVGVARLARGRSDGFAQFGDTPQAFLSSLAPIFAFPIVGTVLSLADGGGRPAITDLLATICAVLAPPVISHVLARLWGRELLWPRFATAFNWCQLAIPVVAAGILLVLGALMAIGISAELAAHLMVIPLAGYALWLHWFLARHGLRLAAWRSILFVVLVNLGTALAILVPHFAATEMPTGQSDDLPAALKT